MSRLRRRPLLVAVAATAALGLEATAAQATPTAPRTLPVTPP